MTWGVRCRTGIAPSWPGNWSPTAWWTSISPQTVQRILAHHKLKPWRQHLWLSPKVPRDAAFVAAGEEHLRRCTPGRWRPHEMVLCVDEKTSLQPRPRKSPTLPAQPGRPVRVEHEYGRKGALNLFAAFDTRTGKVYGHTAERKRQAEFIEFLEQLDREIPADGHDGPPGAGQPADAQGQAGAGVAGEASAVRVPPPAGALLVDESGGAVVQHPAAQAAGRSPTSRTRPPWRSGCMRSSASGTSMAHPFNWTTKSVAKIMAKCEIPLAKAG